MEKTMEIKCSNVGEAYYLQDEVSKFINPSMNGIDIGSGGTPIFIQTISMDFHYPGVYSELVQLKGNANNLYWFKDNCMDYAISIHCLEDFLPEEKAKVLVEWCRIVKVGGYLILDLPDEKLYRAWCNKYNEGKHNLCHKDSDFNITKVRNLMNNNCKSFKEIYYKIHEYSFFLVYQREK